MTEDDNDAEPKRTTRSGRLYAQLRRDILDGELPPDSRLAFADLVERYVCSIGSLREVLQRLSEQGLVESVAQQGFRVMAISSEDLKDLIEARIEIEVAALRHAVADGDVSWEARAVSAHHVLARTPAVSEQDPSQFTDEWAYVHAEFHKALLSGCRNRRLLAAAASLRDAAEMYRRWTIPFGVDRARDSAGEHSALLNAAITREADQAAELLVKHISNTSYELRSAPNAKNFGGLADMAL